MEKRATLRILGKCEIMVQCDFKQASDERSRKLLYDICQMDFQIREELDKATPEILKRAYDDVDWLIREQDFCLNIWWCLEKDYFSKGRKPFTKEQIAKETSYIFNDKKHELYKKCADIKYYPLWSAVLYVWVRNIVVEEVLSKGYLVDFETLVKDLERIHSKRLLIDDKREQQLKRAKGGKNKDHKTREDCRYIAKKILSSNPGITQTALAKQISSQCGIALSTAHTRAKEVIGKIG